MRSVRFERPNEEEAQQSVFEQLFRLFKEMLVVTSGDVEESLDWLKELDDEYQITNKEYTLDDFIDELKRRGYIESERVGIPGMPAQLKITAKTEKLLRSEALEQLFGKLKKNSNGNHATKQFGKGDETVGSLRTYEFGDNPNEIAIAESIKNALINNGIDEIRLQQQDLEVEEKQSKANLATVLMIDISHSMILYGEDRITPAKKVAMALAELIKTRYPKDSLDIIVFGNDAWPISIKDLPYLQVGPYHTNTVAGLELAMDILRRKKNSNKQIFMITDGKPSCLLENGSYYKNSFGLDRKIVNKCLTMAAACRKLKIPITTFMIASDPYLQQFIQEFTEVNKGKALFTGLNNLGEMILEDYTNHKKRKL